MASPTVHALVERWEAARKRGLELTLEELCANCPELLDQARHALMEQWQGSARHESASTPSKLPSIEGGVESWDSVHQLHTPPLPANQVMGRGVAPPGYEILGELGRGGMGVVYRARQLVLNRLCALKMIREGEHAGDEERSRFLAEAEAIARVKHPGIVQVYDFGTYEGLPFFSLELCEGGSLAGTLRESPLLPREAAEVVEQIARAVQAAHDQGIVHRDLKPANVLLASPGIQSGESLTLKITDIGLAKRLEQVGQTQSGAVMGTPSYMAPEQAQGKKTVGPSADIWALGAVLYECLTGRPPFRAATHLDTIIQVINEEPVSVRQLNRQVSADLETIAHKCLQKDPAKRYATAQELADDLGRYLHGEPIVARPVGTLERVAKWVGRNRVVAALLATVAMAILAGAGLSAWFAYQSNKEAITARNAEREADEQRGQAIDNAKEARDALRRAEQSEASAREFGLNERRAREAMQVQKAHAENHLRKAEWATYAGKLMLAQAAFNATKVSEAIRHLDECQWDLRGWEHGHLRWRFDSSKQTLRGHQGNQLCVAWSPDGRRLLSVGTDGMVRIWDAEKGQVLFTVQANPGTGVAWSPDGQRFLTGCWDKTAQVWDAEKGTALLTLKGHTNWVTSVAFSSDGKRIVTGSDDKTAKLWDAVKGTELHSLLGHTNSVTSVAFSPDGQRILTGSWDNTAKVWDADKGQVYLTLEGHTNLVSSVAWSPDGQRILTASRDKTVKIWDARTGKATLHLRGHGEWVRSAAWSPDGQRILTGSYDTTAKIWDARNGQVLQSLQGHIDVVTSVGWSPDGQRVVTGGNERTVKVWDANKGQEVLILSGHTHRVYSAVWSPDGQRILTGSGDHNQPGKPGESKVWDAATGAMLFTLQGHTDSVYSAAWSTNGQRLLTGSRDGTARVWDAQKGTELHALRGHINGVISVAFSPDSQRILTASFDRTIKVWDAQNGREILSLKGHKAVVTSLAFSPDGNRIVSGGEGFYYKPGQRVSDEVKVWDAKSGLELLSLSLRGHDPVRCVTWSPDGQRIVTGGNDTTAKVWDAITGQEIVSLRGHQFSVNSVAWSPDGRRILTGSDDHTVKIWDPVKGREVFSFQAHSAPITSVAWSPDGQRILTGSDDHTVKIWDSANSQDFLSLQGHRGLVFSVAWSPNGQRLLTGGGDQVARVWDVTKGSELLSLRGHTGGVGSVGWSPDGQRIVTGSTDQMAKVWDAQKGTELLSLRGHTGGVSSTAWSPDGQRIVTGSEDYTVRMWDAVNGQLIHTLVGHQDYVTSLAWSSDSKRVFAWDKGKTVLAWSADTGRPVDSDHPPARPQQKDVISPNGFLRAWVDGGFTAQVCDRRRPLHVNTWLFPDRAERLRYHGEKATANEKDQQWFAAGFHLRRMMKDEPENALLKQRLQTAEAKWKAERAKPVSETQPARMERVP